MNKSYCKIIIIIKTTQFLYSGFFCKTYPILPSEILIRTNIRITKYIKSFEMHKIGQKASNKKYSDKKLHTVPKSEKH